MTRAEVSSRVGAGGLATGPFILGWPTFARHETVATVAGLRGHGVAEDLNVDPAGLLTAAAGSDGIAAALGTTPSAVSAAGGQATHAAVSALDAAIAAARSSQSGRVAQQAADMQSASSNYQGTDERAADNLAGTM